MKKVLFFLFIFSIFFSQNLHAGFFQKKQVRDRAGTPESRATDEMYRKMFLRTQLMQTANSFEDALHFNQAIVESKKALGNEYLTTNEDKGLPLMTLMSSHSYLGEYGTAVEFANEFIQNKPNNEWGVEQKKKIEALLEFQKTGNKQLIYDWIASQKKKYAHWLPPTNPKKTVWDSFLMVEFVALYDLLGDYDLALAEIAPFLKLYREVGSGETGALENLIKALQESKSGMPKICIEDGKVCLGRATAYIIKSKSF